MFRIKDVKVRVMIGSYAPQYVLANGFIAKLGKIKTGKVVVMAELSSVLKIYAFNVDGQKNVTLMKNRSTVGSRRYYRLCITIINEGISPYTKHPSNNLRLLEFDNKTSGLFRIWEAAVVSQHGEFYLSMQITYQAQLYMDKNDAIICPFFQLVTSLAAVN